MTITYGQPVAGEERHEGARPRTSAAGLGSVDGRRPGHPGDALWDMIESEIRDRWSDRAWYRHRRGLAVGSARTLEYASAAAAAWDSLIADNDRELRTLVRVLRRARRRWR